MNLWPLIFIHFVSAGVAGLDSGVAAGVATGVAAGVAAGVSAGLADFEPGVSRALTLVSIASCFLRLSAIFLSIVTI